LYIANNYPLAALINKDQFNDPVKI
jgi:hypothetical protein